MTTLAMTSALNNGFQEIMAKFVTAQVQKLADKYEFDFDEACAALELERTPLDVAPAKPVKNPRKSTKKAKEVVDSGDEETEPSAEKQKTKPKKEKKPVDENKPKRPPSGYQLFSKEHRAAVTEELNAQDNKARGAVMTELGARWKALDQVGQDEWNTRAKQAAAASLNTTSEDDE